MGRPGILVSSRSGLERLAQGHAREDDAGAVVDEEVGGVVALHCTNAGDLAPSPLSKAVGGMNRNTLRKLEQLKKRLSKTDLTS